MTLARFYESLGGSLPAVLARIPSEAMVRKFARMYAGDTSCDELVRAVEAKDWQTAFRAAHTLKGVCANLGLEKLRQSAGGLTEELRPEQDKIPAEAFSRMEELRRDYRTAEDAISQLLTEK